MQLTQLGRISATSKPVGMPNSEKFPAEVLHISKLWFTGLKQLNQTFFSGQHVLVAHQLLFLFRLQAT